MAIWLEAKTSSYWEECQDMHQGIYEGKCKTCKHESAAWWLKPAVQPGTEEQTRLWYFSLKRQKLHGELLKALLHIISRVTLGIFSKLGHFWESESTFLRAGLAMQFVDLIQNEYIRSLVQRLRFFKMVMAEHPIRHGGQCDYMDHLPLTLALLKCNAW